MKIYADRRMIVMLLLGFASGLPFLLVSSTLSLWLKDIVISLAAIGLFSLVKAPYSFKWLLSPVIDQYSLPLFSKLGRRRGWAVFLQILLIISLIYTAFTNPDLSPLMFVFFVFMIALFSASQDIVLDAYRRRMQPKPRMEIGLPYLSLVIASAFCSPVPVLCFQLLL